MRYLSPLSTRNRLPQQVYVFLHLSLPFPFERSWDKWYTVHNNQQSIYCRNIFKEINHLSSCGWAYIGHYEPYSKNNSKIYTEGKHTAWASTLTNIVTNLFFKWIKMLQERTHHYHARERIIFQKCMHTCAINARKKNEPYELINWNTKSFEISESW